MRRNRKSQCIVWRNVLDTQSGNYEYFILIMNLNYDLFSRSHGIHGRTYFTVLDTGSREEKITVQYCTVVYVYVYTVL